MDISLPFFVIEKELHLKKLVDNYWINIKRFSYGGKKSRIVTKENSIVVEKEEVSEKTC